MSDSIGRKHLGLVKRVQTILSLSQERCEALIGFSSFLPKRRAETLDASSAPVHSSSADANLRSASTDGTK